MSRAKVLFLMLSAMLLSGCADNNYSRFYHASSSATDIAPFSGTPVAEDISGSRQIDKAELFTKGLDMVGYAEYTGPREAEDDADKQALEQATAVHASLVFLNHSFDQTITYQEAVKTPVTVTLDPSQTRGTPLENVQTIQGTTTTYETRSYDQYRHQALFFAPLQRIGLGLQIGPVDSGLRSQIGEDGGVVVLAVRDESPASKAAIVPHDVLMRVNGTLITSTAEAKQLISANIGKTSEMMFWRYGITRTINVTVPTGW